MGGGGGLCFSKCVSMSMKIYSNMFAVKTFGADKTPPPEREFEGLGTKTDFLS